MAGIPLSAKITNREGNDNKGVNVFICNKLAEHKCGWKCQWILVLLINVRS